MPDHPAIVGAECRACGALFFPYQPFGCERCGSLDVAQRRFDGHGRVLTLARVHYHADPRRIAPFTVAAVALDAGIFMRAVIAEDGADLLAIGDTVVTKLVPRSPGDMELQFAREMP